MATADLIEALRSPACYPHPVDAVEAVETHISWVLLAGEFAYKLKKPVDFGFLDFGTLEKRRACCEEEVRLNRRLAPALYLGVVDIAGDPAAPRVGEILGVPAAPRVAASGPVLEVAVKMRRFRRDDELDALARRGELRRGHVEALAEVVARFHARAAVGPPEAGYGTPQTVLAPCEENLAHLARLDHDPDDAQRLARIADWTRRAHAALAPTIAARLTDGFVRECHGDLHLANIVIIDGAPVPFDAIEFNPRLRWIDVVSEIAFTTMDLVHRGRADLARVFLNAWLEATGDYAGLALLPFYQVYRAVVRAKVAGLRAEQATAGSPAQRALVHELRAHLRLAEHFATQRPRALVLTCGPSGSGKSRLAGRLLEHADWIRLRSDVERKRLAGLDARARDGAALGIYDAEVTARTYARLETTAETVLDAGYPVIVDATFAERAQRERFRELGRRLRAPLAVLLLQAEPSLLRERVTARARAARDPSDATPAVLERQLGADWPSAAEAADVIVVDSTRDPDAAALSTRLLSPVRGVG
jgi:hypothetical protein